MIGRYQLESWAIASLFVVFSAGCDSPSITPVNVATTRSRDSVSVRIIESDRPSGERGASVDTLRDLIIAIGSPNDKSQNDDFSSVIAAFLLPDSVIAVVDESQRMRYFNTSGAYLGSGGAVGDGPGEFVSIFAVHRLDPDTLLISDHGARLSVWADTGKLVRSMKLVGAHFAHHQFADGTILGNPSNESPDYVRPVDGRGPKLSSIDSSRYGLVDRNGVYQQYFGSFPAITRFGGDYSSALAFGSRGYGVAHGDQFYHTFGDRYEVSVYNKKGHLVKIIRRADEPREVSVADRDLYLKNELSKLRPGERPLDDKLATTLRIQVEQGSAKTHPAFSGMLVSRSGDIWLRLHRREDSFFRRKPTDDDVPHHWIVVDSSGNWLPGMVFPARFTPTEIGSDYVIGSSFDSAGVPLVLLFRLQNLRLPR